MDKQLEEMIEAFSIIVNERIATAIGPLVKRIGELEARPRGLIYQGTWAEGSTYEKDDGVTFQGSIFIALRETSTRPDDSPHWRLAVKRGRDGKDASK